jgi:type I restriction enzyme S subunit
MAETLFRQWFVEEAGEDWEEVPLSYFGKIICGKTPSKKKPEFYNGDIPFIKIPDMHRNTYIFHTADTLTMEGSNSQKNKLLPPESICVSCIATVGLVSMNIVESQTNQQINSIIPSKDVYRYFLYLYMKASYGFLAYPLLAILTSPLMSLGRRVSRRDCRVRICFWFENILLNFVSTIL